MFFVFLFFPIDKLPIKLYNMLYGYGWMQPKLRSVGEKEGGMTGEARFKATTSWGQTPQF